MHRIVRIAGAPDLISSAVTIDRTTHPGGIMKTTVLWALVIINALLLASFVGRFSNWGHAVAQPARQPAPVQPRPGDYLMIPGDVTGGSAGIIYIVDMTNGRLSAMSYDESNRRLVSMQSIDLAPIFQRGAVPGAPPRPGR
jgi:hypothetical protein